MDSFSRFDEDRLPSKKKFYSSLKSVGISNDDYERANKVWNAFDMKNVGHYECSLECIRYEKFGSLS